MQLAVAFGVLVLWRSRRLGRPVLEPQPVQLAGSELVVAVGELLQRAKGREQAASVLRDDLRRWLAERLGLPPATPAEVVAEAAAAARRVGSRRPRRCWPCWRGAGRRTRMAWWRWPTRWSRSAAGSMSSRGEPVG